MDIHLTANFQTSTQLGIACYVLDFITDDINDGFADDKTSPIPTGQTPGDLSSTISLQAVSLLSPPVSTYVEKIFFRLVRLVQKSSDTIGKEVHILLQKLAWAPEGQLYCWSSMLLCGLWWIPSITIISMYIVLF